MPESQPPEPLALLQDCPEVSADELAWISEAEMVEVDRVMMEELTIGLIQMMENAGRALARVVKAQSGARRVVVAAGSGGNGGGGLVAARHLANAGFEVGVATTRPRSEMKPVPAHQLGILERMGVQTACDLSGAEMFVDAVIGYSLAGAPRGRSAEFVEASKSATMVVSLDTPSGMDVTTGDAPGAVVQADATVTLALPKRGMRSSGLTGELYLADISVPPAVTQSYGSPPPPFGTSGLLRIRR